MPRKLAIIEIETDEDERLCGESCRYNSVEFLCPTMGSRHLVQRLPREVWQRTESCLESTRLASLDRAVVEAAEKFSADWSDFDGTDSEQTLLALHEAVKERRDANG